MKLLERIEQLEQLAAKATEGPWWHYYSGEHGHRVIQQKEKYWLESQICPAVRECADAQFIAAAREAVPELCQALREALAKIDLLEAKSKLAEEKG